MSVCVYINTVIVSVCVYVKMQLSPPISIRMCVYANIQLQVLIGQICAWMICEFERQRCVFKLDVLNKKMKDLAWLPKLIRLAPKIITLDAPGGLRTFAPVASHLAVLAVET